MLLIKTLIDAYKFFDRHWRIILIASLISLGLAEAANISMQYFAHLPKLKIFASNGQPNGHPISFSYNDLLAIIIYFLFKIWFDGFIAKLAISDLEGISIKFKDIAKQTLKIYPHLLAIAIFSQLIINSGAFISFLSLMYSSTDSTLGTIGLLFIIPSLIFSVWFALIVPVFVIDNIQSAILVLQRSRFLVLGFFWTVFLVLIISALPTFAIAGSALNTSLFIFIASFVNISSTIIGTLLITFVYINLRAVKGETITKQNHALIRKSSNHDI